MNASEADELRFALDRVRGQLEDCAVHGTRARSAEDRGRLRSLIDELHGLGAVRLGGRLEILERSLGTIEAPTRLMEAQTALRLVERVSTLEVSAEELLEAAWRQEDRLREDGEES